MITCYVNMTTPFEISVQNWSERPRTLPKCTLIEALPSYSVFDDILWFT